MDVTTFRARLNKWLKDFEGWPVYNKATNAKPDASTLPRIPGAYNVFANLFAGAKTNASNGVLSWQGHPLPYGPAVTNLISLLSTCQTSTTGVCENYNKLVNPNPSAAPTGLFTRNYKDYLGQGCPALQFLNTEMLKRIYGWVPFNCSTNPKANDLLNTAKELGLDFNKFQDEVYTHGLQYRPGDATTTFNPYVQLIHGKEYLKMAAYAFSVDDAIGFQSYPGDGIIITLAGVNGMDNPNELDPTKRVVITLGPEHPGIPEWSTISLCSPTFTKPVDPSFTSVLFYPLGYPCTITARDLKGLAYQFNITQGPPNLTVTKTVPPCLPSERWCTNLVVHDVNFIDTTTVEPDPPPSTHDFNGNGKSDILWRDASGTVAMWMMDGAVLALSIPLSSPTRDNTWSIVGQRDFDRDGKADLLWRKTNGNLERWFLNGTGTGPAIIQIQPFGNVSTDWTVVGTGDFNGDGFGDALWRCTTDGPNCTSGDVGVWLMNSTTQLIATNGFKGVPLTWSIVGVGHFNGNTSIPRNSDILWRDATTGAVAIWFMNGVSFVTSQTIGAKPADWTVVGTGDFDGDGFDDILWRRNNGELEIWLIKGEMNSATIKQTHNFGVIPTDWSVALTGDFDFDGKSDILWRKTGSISPGAVGTTSIWFMNGVAIKSTGNVGVVDLSWTVQSAGAE